MKVPFLSSSSYKVHDLTLDHKLRLLAESSNFVKKYKHNLVNTATQFRLIDDAFISSSESVNAMYDIYNEKYVNPRVLNTVHQNVAKSRILLRDLFQNVLLSIDHWEIRRDNVEAHCSTLDKTYRQREKKRKDVAKYRMEAQRHALNQRQYNHSSTSNQLAIAQDQMMNLNRDVTHMVVDAAGEIDVLIKIARHQLPQYFSQLLTAQAAHMRVLHESYEEQIRPVCEGFVEMVQRPLPEQLQQPSTYGAISAQVATPLPLPAPPQVGLSQPQLSALHPLTIQQPLVDTATFKPMHSRIYEPVPYGSASPTYVATPTYMTQRSMPQLTSSSTVLQPLQATVDPLQSTENMRTVTTMSSMSTVPTMQPMSSSEVMQEKMVRSNSAPEKQIFTSSSTTDSMAGSAMNEKYSSGMTQQTDPDRLKQQFEQKSESVLQEKAFNQGQPVKFNFGNTNVVA
eukprot:GILK01012156.1.p1 GENE.GILK01012156.1~~GILK01012156.1.p1  ORF type:complete len:454 (-),score=81.37 GILK01012156.1:129-1490(-)